MHNFGCPFIKIVPEERLGCELWGSQHSCQLGMGEYGVPWFYRENESCATAATSQDGLGKSMGNLQEEFALSPL